MIATFYTIYPSNRSIKVKYEYEEQDSDDSTYSILNPNLRKFMNFIMYHMWHVHGATGYISSPLLLDFPACEDYPAHYTLELSYDEYLEFCKKDKDEDF